MKVSLAAFVATASAISGFAPTANAEPLIGELMLWARPAGCPREYLPADGREVLIEKYMALYSVIGPTYGGAHPRFEGDPKVSGFNLPDLRSAAPKSAVGAAPIWCIAAFGIYPTFEESPADKN